MHISSHIYEHKAPTDESVRLLAEFERAAQDKVLRAEKLDSNLISAKLWHIRNHQSFKDEYKILMSINSTQFIYDISLDADLTKMEKMEKMEKLFEVIARRIAAELMNSVSKETN